jgi:hypothetical protein
MTTPLELNAAPSAGFDQPFELLAACHQRVLRMLQLLQRLQAHLGTKGADPEAGRAALDVMRYFDIAGPAHHEDEERHVFPRLRDAGLGQLAERLQLEHLAMAEAWNGAQLGRHLGVVLQPLVQPQGGQHLVQRQVPYSSAMPVYCGLRAFLPAARSTSGR